MSILTLAIGIAISAWAGIMGLSAIFKTEGAKKWFGEMLGQSPTLMTMNGLGLFVAAALVALNLIFPAMINAIIVKWALVGIGVAQLSSIFMMVRGSATRAAMSGPIVLFALTVIYWFIRT